MLDINTDGHIDIVSLSFNTNFLTIYLGSGTGQFQRASPSNIRADGPSDFALADIGNNNTVDIVVASQVTDSIEVFCNQSISSFAQLNQSNLDTSAPVGKIEVTDVNADGLPDIVMLSQAQNNNQLENISLFVAVGDGNFQPPITGSVKRMGQDFVTTDLDNNSVLDAIVIQDNEITVFPLTNALGVADLPVNVAINIPTGGSCIAIGDLNKDGRIEAVIGNRLNGTLTLFAGQSNSPFFGISSDIFSATDSAIENVLIADMNNNGALDIIAALPGTNQVLIMFNDPSNLGNFSNIPIQLFNFPVFDEPTFIGLEDFNSDGFLDIATTTDSSVKMLLSNGQGGFENIPSPVAFTFVNPSQFDTADINQDGLQDLIVSDAGSEEINILLGQGTGQFIPGATSSLSDFNTLTVVAVADANTDGDLDIIYGTAPSRARIFLNVSRKPVNRFVDGPEKAIYPTITSLNPQVMLLQNTHLINTDAGTIDGVKVQNFNGQTFFFQDFVIASGANVVVVGRNPFIVRALKDIRIDGTLSLDAAT